MRKEAERLKKERHTGSLIGRQKRMGGRRLKFM